MPPPSFHPSLLDSLTASSPAIQGPISLSPRCCLGNASALTAVTRVLFRWPGLMSGLWNGWQKVMHLSWLKGGYCFWVRLTDGWPRHLKRTDLRGSFLWRSHRQRPQQRHGRTDAFAFRHIIERGGRYGGVVYFPLLATNPRNVEAHLKFSICRNNTSVICFPIFFFLNKLK